MDESDRCHVEYSIQKWCRLLGLKQKKLISFLELTKNQLKTKVVYSENIIRIEIPNLLKKRDNYTKNLQVTKKPLTTIEVEVDKEVERPLPANTGLRVMPDEIVLENSTIDWCKKHEVSRGEWENAVESCSEWAKSKGIRRHDWISQLQGNIRRDRQQKGTWI